MSVIGTIAPPDPADVFLISSIVLNRFRGERTLDHVFTLNGETYCDVSSAHRSAFEPPDTVTYKFYRGERNVRGEDVEVIELLAVARRDGDKEYEETGDAL